VVSGWQSAEPIYLSYADHTVSFDEPQPLI
jgi:hypothetical protein